MRNSFSVNWGSWGVVCAILLWCGLGTSAAAAQPLSADLDAEELPALMRQQAQGDTLLLQHVPLDKNQPLATLLLERFKVFTDDARIVVHSDTEETVLEPPRNAYYRGRVEGDPDSQVYVVLPAKGNLRGLIKSAGQYWVLEDATSGAPAASVPMLRRIDPSTEFSGRGFQCGSDQLEQLTPFAPQGFEEQQMTSSLLSPQTSAASQLPNLDARIAIETDWEFFQKFGNTTAAINYIGDLLGASSALYRAEVGFGLLVSSISLWTTSNDPWRQTNAFCGLMEFGRYWSNNRDAIPRTTAHFLSGKQSGGGVAWLGVLCAPAFPVNIGSSCSGLPAIDNYGGAYGYSGDLKGTFNPNNPGIVWDLVVFSHELGHNFNSPHTHCYGGIGGNANPVDQCYGGESGNGCYRGTGKLPGPAGQGSGTLMSYCHLLYPGLGNLAFTFGKGHPYGVAPDRAPARMFAHATAAATANPSCFAPQHMLRINDVSRAEGSSGTTKFTFKVTLSPASASTVKVNYATANGSAKAGSDYAAIPLTPLTFTAGQTSKTVTVNVKGDTTKEANETFLVKLSGAVGATIFDGQGKGTVLNDDGPVLRINDVSRAEGSSGTTKFTFKVTLSPASASTVKVNYATANGSAKAGSDYAAIPLTPLTFTAGQTSKTVTVNVKGDTTKEANETFLVKLSGAVGATIFDGQGKGTITNDD